MHACMQERARRTIYYGYYVWSTTLTTTPHLASIAA